MSHLSLYYFGKNRSKVNVWHFWKLFIGLRHPKLSLTSHVLHIPRNMSIKKQYIYIIFRIYLSMCVHRTIHTFMNFTVFVCVLVWKFISGLIPDICGGCHFIVYVVHRVFGRNEIWKFKSVFSFFCLFGKAQQSENIL